MNATSQDNVSVAFQSGPTGALLPQSEIKKPNVPDASKNIEFPAWLRRELGKIDKQDMVEEVRRTQVWVRNHRFYRGQQLGFISDLDGRWHDLEDTAGLYINNQFSFFVDSLAKEWEQSATKFKIIPETDEPKKVGSARFATRLIEEYQRKILTASFRQREGKFALLSGTYFRYTFFSTEVQGITERIPVTEQRQIQTPGYYQCQCGSHDLPPGMDAPLVCPTCGQQPLVMPGSTVKTSVVAGYQKQQVGDICTECVDPIEVKVHLHARTIGQSPYLRRKRLVLKQILRDQYPLAQIESKESASSQVLIYQRALEQTSGNTFYSNRPAAGAIEPDEDLVEFEQYWLDTAYYKKYELPADLQLAGGDLLPKGTKLIELCPDGLYVAKAGDEILDIRNENKNDHWSGGTFHLEPSKFYGKGLEDLIDLQEQINEVHSLVFDHVMRNAAPPLIFDPMAINPEDFTGKPGGVVPVRPGTYEKGLSSTVFQLPSVSMDALPLSLLESYKKDMKDAAPRSHITNLAP